MSCNCTVLKQSAHTSYVKNPIVSQVLHKMASTAFQCHQFSPFYEMYKYWLNFKKLIVSRHLLGYSCLAYIHQGSKCALFSWSVSPSNPGNTTALHFSQSRKICKILLVRTSHLASKSVYCVLWLLWDTEYILVSKGAVATSFLYVKGISYCRRQRLIKLLPCQL